jgi:hypothetical protein
LGILLGPQLIAQKLQIQLSQRIGAQPPRIIGSGILYKRIVGEEVGDASEILFLGAKGD